MAPRCLHWHVHSVDPPSEQERQVAIAFNRAQARAAKADPHAYLPTRLPCFRLPGPLPAPLPATADG
eukprot:5138054-Lingulodinium_polyedra.AAC.1